MHASESSMPSSMLTSRMLAPPRTWSSATCGRPGPVLGLDQPREALRAGDVGALADHLEVAVGAQDQRLEARVVGEAAEAAVGTAGGGMRPRRDAVDGAGDGGDVRRASCRSSRRRCSGSRSRRTRPAAPRSRRPAGRTRRRRWAARRWGSSSRSVPAMRASSAMYGRISRAPSAQLMPTLNGRACSIEV